MHRGATFPPVLFAIALTAACAARTELRREPESSVRPAYTRVVLEDESGVILRHAFLSGTAQEFTVRESPEEESAVVVSVARSHRRSLVGALNAMLRVEGRPELGAGAFRRHVKAGRLTCHRAFHDPSLGSIDDPATFAGVGAGCSDALVFRLGETLGLMKNYDRAKAGLIPEARLDRPAFGSGSAAAQEPPSEVSWDELRPYLEAAMRRLDPRGPPEASPSPAGQDVSFSICAQNLGELAEREPALSLGIIRALGALVRTEIGRAAVARHLRDEDFPSGIFEESEVLEALPGLLAEEGIVLIGGASPRRDGPSPEAPPGSSR